MMQLCRLTFIVTLLLARVLLDPVVGAIAIDGGQYQEVPAIILALVLEEPHEQLGPSDVDIKAHMITCGSKK
jgi:hypothetical protein